MPSFVILPLSQCHHTRGRAPFGGFSNPLLSGSALVCGLVWENTAIALSSTMLVSIRALIVLLNRSRMVVVESMQLASRVPNLDSRSDGCYSRFSRLFRKEGDR